MTIEKIHDRGRRKLLAATMGVGGVGAIAAAWPFLNSMAPSERAKAAGAPVEVDLSTIAPGRLVTVEFRGKPIWVLHRTEEMIKLIGGHDGVLADPNSERSVQPDYAKNPARSLKPPFFVATAVCTHLGCIPSFRPEPGAADLGAEWPGGFYCPCHGSKFDLAGRVIKNVPAPINLEIPDYQFLSDTRLLIGADKKST
jgi:ubiquinol-cytochrome c reductase iron-sulfur subunit